MNRLLLSVINLHDLLSTQAKSVNTPKSTRVWNRPVVKSFLFSNCCICAEYNIIILAQTGDDAEKFRHVYAFVLTNITMTYLNKTRTWPKISADRVP